MAGDDAERQHDSNNENFDGTFFGWFGLDGALSRSLSDGTFRMKKGRALNAPPSVAPLSARPENTPSRALGARARGRSLDKKLAVFRRDRSRSYAKLLVSFRFVQFLIFLLLPRILPPGAVHWQGCVIASSMARSCAAWRSGWCGCVAPFAESRACICARHTGREEKVSKEKLREAAS